MALLSGLTGVLDRFPRQQCLERIVGWLRFQWTWLSDEIEVPRVSYDLVFWRQLNGYEGQPVPTYRSLINGDRADGLADLDTEAMLSAVQAAFPEAIREQNGPGEWIVWTSASGADSFQIEWTAQHFSVACRHVHSDDMNRLIDWAAAFGCPLYDPQTNERFSP